MEQSDIILDLKRRIKENIAVHDEVICNLCDNLIKEATILNDMVSIAFAYVWKADYYFYVEPSRDMMLTQLREAEIYINENEACDLLEKYYTLFRLYYRYIDDHKSSLSYTLKALKVAETIQSELRISANTAIIGEYYLDHGCYSEALYYLKKSLQTLDFNNPENYRTMRLILISLFDCLIYLNEYNQAKETLNYLSNLKLEEVDLKVYVDRCQMVYYSYLKDEELTNSFASEMLKDGVMEFVNARFAFDFISNLFHSMTRIENEKEAKRAIELLKQLIRDEDYDQHLKIASFQIVYNKQFNPKKLAQSYKAYYHDYNNALNLLEQLKVEGLNAKILLHETALIHNEMSEKIKAMEDEAIVDELTNVYNRRFLNDKQNAIIHDASNKNVGYIILDIDYFKEYNDYYGHVLGDEVLRQVASILKDNCFHNMEVCRYGGDEFICVLWNSDITIMNTYIETVQSALFELNFEHQNSSCSNRVTLSIGYGIHRLPIADHLYCFIEEVDQALYHAKEKGRNRAFALIYEEEVMECGE